MPESTLNKPTYTGLCHNAYNFHQHRCYFRILQYTFNVMLPHSYTVIPPPKKEIKKNNRNGLNRHLLNSYQAIICFFSPFPVRYRQFSYLPPALPTSDLGKRNHFNSKSTPNDFHGQPFMVSECSLLISTSNALAARPPLDLNFSPL